MSTRERLVQQMAEAGLTHQQARTVMESVLDEISSQLETGEEVLITNFGRFELRDREGRTMTNPKTGEVHDIPPRQVVHFSPSEKFKQLVDDSYEPDSSDDV